MRIEQPTKCFVPFQKLRARLDRRIDLPHLPPSNSLLTVLMRLYFCGSMLPVFWCPSSTFHLMFFILLLIRFGLLSGHLLGKCCPLG